MKKTTLILLLIVSLLAVALAACGGGGKKEAAESESKGEVASMPAGDATKGAELYSQTCQACHGEGGVGVPGLGKDLTSSDFVKGLSDAELLEFIKKGRDAGDPDNTTGIAMPPKGGNSSLSDEQIMDIIAYIRSIQK